jgi:chromosome segregation ATPase
VSKASDALQTTLENTSATPEEIKAKLTALRTAREKARQELATAQKELREVLSLRQEAQMVLMGMLN